MARFMNENACAVASLRVAAACAAVREIDENFDSLADDVVRLFAVQINDETHAARVMLVTGVVQPLRLQGREFGGVRHNSEYLSPYYHVNKKYYLAI